MKAGVLIRISFLTSLNCFARVRNPPLRPFFSSKITSLYVTMTQTRQNGAEAGATSQDASISTEVLPVNSLIARLPSWSALEDPLKCHRRSAHQLPQEPLKNLERAANQLSSPEPHLVAFPTETVYGLGADATRSACVRKIYWAKNRPADNPLIVHIASLKQLSDLTGEVLPSIYEPLVKKFWPGPLTIILPLPDPSPFAPEVTHNLKTFGVRMPATPLARLLIALSGRPIAAPSANTSKRPSTTTAQHVLEDLDGRVAIILDGGPCGVGVESTVVDGTCNPPAILRPGGVGIEDIRALGGEWEKIVIGYNDVKKHVEMNGEGPRAPGMKYKHYAPKGALHLFEDVPTAANAEWRLAQILPDFGLPEVPSVGVIRVTSSWGKWLGNDVFFDTFTIGEIFHLKKSAIFPAAEGAYCYIGRTPIRMYDMELGPGVEDVAREIFAALRACDELACDVIIVEALPEGTGAEANGLATAVMNRLRKAAMG
jgi:L-threonylcarbamoyladenylate synthase